MKYTQREREHTVYSGKLCCCADYVYNTGVPARGFYTTLNEKYCGKMLNGGSVGQGEDKSSFMYRNMCGNIPVVYDGVRIYYAVYSLFCEIMFIRSFRVTWVYLSPGQRYGVLGDSCSWYCWK